MAEDFGKEVRELWTQAEEADKKNREEALADLKFAAGEHWDERVREFRERQGVDKYGFPLPCLTINNIPAIVAQVTGDRLANEVSVKVLPNEEGDKETADVRSELIRSIEVRSKAQRTYRMSFQAMVNCGISNFRVDLDYAYDDAFERDIFIRSIPNPLAVLWDPMSADPTGKDAGWCFVAENITKDEYKRRFKEEASNVDDFNIPGLQAEGWMIGDTVRIAEYWKVVEKPRTLAMLMSQNGEPTVEDVTDKPEVQWRDRVFVNPTTGKPVLREAKRKYAQRQVTNGRDALDDMYELALCRLPVIRVSGQEIWQGDKRTRFGLVRFARDPARLKDYFRSLLAEKLMLSPRANWIADADAIKGRESDWINAMVFNKNATPPVAITNNDLAAMMNQAEWFAEDMKDVTGIFDASRGMKSNETSGIAIQRRQHEGDIATIGYHENMNAAQQEAGEVMNDLLGLAYDTPRTVRLIGANEATKFLRVNDPADPDSIDLSKGRYDVTISTGPAYMTRRLEGATQLMELARNAPNVMAAAPDLVIKSLDLVDGDEMAERLKRTVPAQVLGDESEEDATPEALAQKAQAQQLAQQMAALEMRLKVAEVDEAEAKAEKARAEASAAKAKPLVDGFNAETNRIKAITAKDFPLPPEAAAILAPIVTQAVLQALGSPDVLPLQPDEEEMIAEGALREAAIAEMNTGPQPPEEGMPQQ